MGINHVPVHLRGLGCIPAVQEYATDLIQQSQSPRWFSIMGPHQKDWMGFASGSELRPAL
jgi:hypothetical protein